MGNGSLINFGTIKKYRQDEFIFHEGEEGLNMYIILSGKVDVYINSFDDMPIKVHEISTGDFFGEMAILEDLPRSASIYASEDTAVIVIERKNFNDLISNRPDIAYKMMKTLSNRIRKVNEELVNKEKVENDDEFLDTSEEKENDLKNEIEDCNDKKYNSSFGIENIVPDKHRLYGFKIYNDKYDDSILEKEVVCPICGEEFSADMIKNSKLQLLQEEKFFRKRYKNINTLANMIWTCPKCLYSNYYYEFNAINSYKLKSIKKLLSETNYSMNVSNSKNDDINTIFLKYYFMLYIEENSRPSPIKISKIWLNLYWLYEDVKDLEMTEYSLKKAHELYKNTYYNCNVRLSKEEELRLGILVAELCGANNEFKDAYRLLSKILVDKRLSHVLKKKASNLMYEYKTIIKKE